MGISDLSISAADYKEVNIKLNKAYIIKLRNSPAEIVLVTNEQNYYLREGLPNDPDLTKTLAILKQSETVTLFVSNNRNVGGLLASQLAIPMSQGIDREHGIGKMEIGVSGFFFVAGIVFFIYKKIVFEEDWVNGYVPEPGKDEIVNLNLNQNPLSTANPPSDDHDFIKLDLK
jgi:hypothetical protein